jgi:ribonucleoside-diphosphate reductase alpha chain
MVVQSAWATGEPGLCFIDRVNQYNPTPQLGPILSTNPCGEQPLLDYESCNLGSINIAAFVNRDRGELLWDGLAATIHQAVRFLDNVIDANHYPLEETRKITLANRKIGLGVMGFADALILLGIRYDSDEALAFAGKVAEFLTHEAHEASKRLAELRGSFPNWEGSIWDTRHSQPMRNAACTTIAPTGSISIIAGCSSGIEPVFSFAGKRRALDGEEFVYIHPLLEELGAAQGWLDERTMAALLAGTPPADMEGIPPRLAHALVAAHEVSPECHVRIQAAFQKHIDNPISKTVNLPCDAIPEDVDKASRLAYRLGCKGITVYRDGSRAGQTLSRAGADDGEPQRIPRSRPHVTSGQTFKYRMGCGTLFVTVNRDGKGLCEVFANLGKAGGCPSQSEATCRAVSVGLRSGIEPAILIEQLKGIRCLSTCVARKADEDVEVLSCPDAIATAIEEAIGEGSRPGGGDGARRCPDCGARLRKEEGCLVCECGFSNCG